MFTNSIRWRLQLWLAFLLVCILSGLGVAAYQLHRTNQFSQIDQELDRRVAALSSALRGRPPFELHAGRPPFGDRSGRPPMEDDSVRPPERRGRPDLTTPRGPPEAWPGPREIRLSPQVLSLFEESDTNAFYFVIRSRDGALLKGSTNVPSEIQLPERSSTDAGTHRRMRGAYREAFYFTGLGDCVLVGRSIVADLKDMQRFAWWLVAAASAVLALGLAGSWLLATRAMRPIEDISATASRISAGNLSERISVANDDDELGRLAGVLNSTFTRLDAAFGQQKQFTADASHELRTPLAVLISEAQTALARDRSAAEYRETVEACLDTAQQMRHLTESLLALARLDADQQPMQRNRFDLTEKVRACVEQIRPLADARGIQIHTDLAPVNALGDADRFSQVITNLLTNAIHYNQEHGEIRVSTRTENGVASLTVADTGIGIATADLPHIFERFYRADKSRSRSQGCNGLGLAITKAIVEAHQGTIEVKSELGRGSIFTIRMPQSQG